MKALFDALASVTLVMAGSSVFVGVGWLLQGFDPGWWLILGALPFLVVSLFYFTIMEKK